MNLLKLKKIVSNYLSGHASTEETAVIEQWFKEARVAADKETDQGQYDERKERALSNIKTIIKTGSIRKPRYLNWAAAACLTGILFGGYLFRNELTDLMATPVMYTVVTNQYQVREVILPDSSIVVLNVNSRLRYPAKFSRDRSVTLNGEAFFDIRKNPDARFTVKASHLNVNVLGTSFVVSDAGANEMASVEVKTGRVQVAISGGPATQPAILSPAQQFTYAVQRREGKIENNVAVNTAWTSQLLVFRNTPLRDVFAAIEASLPVKIVSGNTEINKRTFTGSFLKEDDITEILNILSLSYGLKIKQTGNLVEVN
ncbi:FecR family protein [Chitinophaga eiseniae]|uniref:DUF4974 domain-containing protein n=1 Tax=Chitinophaga eiseniae TaxID=634771 RepID=A0A847SKF0_9BACT|nr:FecR domain-containing protein [Chitinophaga eiseniae]NLR78008.1 DUF4974 domain-containing protein [Chitinophaga eiseniae]